MPQIVYHFNFKIITFWLFLVHGWISTHSHEPQYTARLGELANLVEYKKNNTADNEMVLFFDTGDLTHVSLSLWNYSIMLLNLGYWT